MSIATVALDADDTLWHNESIFHLTQQQFYALLKDHGAGIRLLLSAGLLLSIMGAI